MTRKMDGVWCYRPESHKTEHHDIERRIYIGPRAQEILRPFLDRDPEVYCFSPAEVVEEQNARKRANRKSPLTRSHAIRKPRARPIRDHYTKDSYNRAISRACELAFGMPKELRDVRRTLAGLPEGTSEAERTKMKERLICKAAEWRKANCWSPNQIRHTRATAIRERYGIEASQTVLGHSDPRVTEVYAERNFGMAARIMREIG